MSTLTETKARPEPKPLPAPNSDFYQLAETLPAEELAVVRQVRAFMEEKVAPIITRYWAEDAFPFELLPAFKELNVGGVGMRGYGYRGGSALLFAANRVGSLRRREDSGSWIRGMRSLRNVPDRSSTSRSCRTLPRSC